MFKKQLTARSRSHHKLIAIIGPTSSGKTALSLQLARRFNGEIVSADSRQLYRGLTIGTGKATRAELRKVPHHLIDWKNPGRTVSLSQYKRAADAALADIWRRSRNAFLVGGTPLYVRALIDNYQIPAVKPDRKLRASLEKKSALQLHAMVKKVDPVTAERIGKQNARRLIRALEICYSTNKKVSDFTTTSQDRYNTLIIGLDIDRKTLYQLIDERVDKRLERGMIAEVKSLLKQGVRKNWLRSLGLEYRAIITYLDEGETRANKLKMADSLKHAIHDFARRQLVWYRKFPNVHWLTPRDAGGSAKLIQRFLSD